MKWRFKRHFSPYQMSWQVTTMHWLKYIDQTNDWMHYVSSLININVRSNGIYDSIWFLYYTTVKLTCVEKSSLKHIIFNNYHLPWHKVQHAMLFETAWFSIFESYSSLIHIVLFNFWILHVSDSYTSNGL